MACNPSSDGDAQVVVGLRPRQRLFQKIKNDLAVEKMTEKKEKQHTKKNKVIQNWYSDCHL